jgi:hypothetical protein
VEHCEDEEWFLIRSVCDQQFPNNFEIAEALRLGPVGRDPGKEKKQEPELLRKSLEEFYRQRPDCLGL